MRRFVSLFSAVLAVCVMAACGRSDEPVEPIPEVPVATPGMPGTPGTPGMPTPPPVAPAGGNVLAVGVPAAGMFAPGLPVDQTGKPYVDYMFTVAAPGNYQFDLISSNTSSYDPYIRILQGANELAHDDDGGDAPLQSRLSHPLQPGAYTVRVTKFGSSQVSMPVPFTLSVTQAAAAPVAAPATGNVLGVGTPAAGIFAPTLPVDASGKPYIDYVLTIPAPGNYRIDLLSSNTSSYDPYIVLMQGTNEVGRDDDGGDQPLQSRLTQMLQPGVYTVRVTKFGGGSVSAPVPFTLTVSQAG